MSLIIHSPSRISLAPTMYIPLLLTLLLALTAGAHVCVAQNTPAQAPAASAPVAETPAAVAPATPAPEAVSDEEVFSVMLLNSQRVGFNRYLRQVGEDGKITSSTWIRMKVGRGSVVIERNPRFQEITAADGTLLTFVYINNDAGNSKRIDGRLEGATLHLEESLADRKSRRTIEWVDGALTGEGVRQLTEKQPTTPGHKFSYTMFECDEQTFMRVETTNMEPREITLFDGSKTQALHTSSRVQRDGMNLLIDEYCDAQGQWLRRDFEIMGMKFTEFRSNRQTAMADFKVHEIFNATLLKSPAHLPDDAPSVTMKLGLKKIEGVEMTSLPTTGPQTIRDNADGTVTLRYQLLHTQAGQTLPYTGEDEEVRRFLKPTRTVQSDDEKIIAAAQAAIGKITDASEAADRIARWINLKMIPDGTVGYATASEVIRDLRGDCTEYSVITAAMCRAVGIPARLVSGYMYVANWEGRKNIFGGHAWAQVYIKGQWVDLDASLDAPYRTPGRIIVSTSAGDEPTNFDDLNLRGALTIISAEAETKAAE